MVQALEAGARSHVAGAWVVHVDVAVALAWQAAPAGHQRVPEVAWGALVTPGACTQRARRGRIQVEWGS